jgi:hypothetical protein
VAFDLASAREPIRERLQAKKVERRCEVSCGNYLEWIPEGDTLLFRGILHNWDDADVTVILQHARQALRNSGRILIAEMLMPQDNEFFVGKLIDIESMLLTKGGFERTEAEYRLLLAECGFVVTAVMATGAPVSIIEARPRR